MPLIPPALNGAVAVATDVLRRVPFGPRVLTSGFVSLLANATPPRPRPFTLAGDYTSWISLTDRSFSGRHLPVAPEGQQLPSQAEVLGLFRRPPGQETPSVDTSVLFLLFAQWFTDSFLRTDHTDWRKNTSTQEIDFCQIYGLSEPKTRLLRSLAGGRLKSQQIDGQEYPPFLFERTPGGTHAVKPEFKGLHDEDWLLDVLLAGVSDRQKDLFFAVGLEHGNSTAGSTALDVLFVREHNRIAGLLAKEYELGREHPVWDRRMTVADLDERLFQTTRLIMVVLLLKLVVEEYIRHIAPHDPPLTVVPGMAAKKPWNRSSWIAVEFDLLYRWHMLVPDQVTTDEGPVDSKTFLRDNNQVVLDRGLEWLMAQCSRSRAARIGLFNTPDFLTDRRTPDHPAVEERSIALMRSARLQSYNAYRQRFGMPPKRDFADLTSDVTVQRRLAELYGDIDHLEWYVGIFAEDHPEDQMMGDLLTAMVGYDAFTQALTNPVLAPQVFNETTFTRAGLKIIRTTRSLQQILARNAADPAAAYCRFTYGPEPTRGWWRRRG
ncbi:MAG: cyclooxygenase [Blastococcus sp.]|jgi:prostaglandin-endoperoxide synthase 2|nr:cyclooxygenase [Blastococcus sp.]